MIIYKVFYKDYELKKGELMAVLTERRRGSRGRSQFESGIRWAKLMFGQMVKDKNAIFIVPDKLIGEEDSIVPAEKLLFTEEQLRERRINSH
jgi:hypothetical protein